MGFFERYGLTRNPTKWAAFLRVGVSMGIAFGLGWSGEQVAVVHSAIELFVQMFDGALVTPNAKLSDSTVTLAKMGEKP